MGLAKEPKRDYDLEARDKRNASTKILVETGCPFKKDSKMYLALCRKWRTIYLVGE